MLTEYMPRETTPLHAEQWLPDNPDSVKSMITWLTVNGFRCTLTVVDDVDVALEFSHDIPDLLAGSIRTGALYPGDYMVCRGSKFGISTASEFTKVYEKRS